MNMWDLQNISELLFYRTFVNECSLLLENLNSWNRKIWKIYQKAWCLFVLVKLWLILVLTLFFPMSLFNPPENIRKPKVFLRFQGDQKGMLGRKGLIYLYLCSRIFRWLFKICKDNQSLSYLYNCTKKNEFFRLGFLQ